MADLAASTLDLDPDIGGCHLPTKTSTQLQPKRKLPIEHAPSTLSTTDEDRIRAARRALSLSPALPLSRRSHTTSSTSRRSKRSSLPALSTLLNYALLALLAVLSFTSTATASPVQSQLASAHHDASSRNGTLASALPGAAAAPAEHRAQPAAAPHAEPAARAVEGERVMTRDQQAQRDADNVLPPHHYYHHLAAQVARDDDQRAPALAPRAASAAGESSSTCSTGTTGEGLSTGQKAAYGIVVPILIILSGVFAGLTLGYMSLDETQLQVLAKQGSPKERMYATRIMPIRKDGHLLLTTLLIANMITNETLPIVADPLLGGGWRAVIFSIVVIVIFAELIPQSVCSRYGLVVGAYMAIPTRVIMLCLWPVAWPVSRILHAALGPHQGIIYRRGELKELVNIHAEGGGHGGDLVGETVMIVGGALDLQEKVVKDAMTPIENVFMLPFEAKLDYATLEKVVRSGHSRIPIYQDIEINVGPGRSAGNSGAATPSKKPSLLSSLTKRNNSSAHHVGSANDGAASPRSDPPSSPTPDHAGSASGSKASAAVALAEKAGFGFMASSSALANVEKEKAAAAVAGNGNGNTITRRKIIGTLLVKSCVLLDPEDAVPVSDMVINAMPTIPQDEPLLNLLNVFQEGRSHMAVVSSRTRRAMFRQKQAATALPNAPPLRVNTALDGIAEEDKEAATIGSTAADSPTHVGTPASSEDKALGRTKTAGSTASSASRTSSAHVHADQAVSAAAAGEQGHAHHHHVHAHHHLHGGWKKTKGLFSKRLDKHEATASIELAQRTSLDSTAAAEQAAAAAAANPNLQVLDMDGGADGAFDIGTPVGIITLEDVLEELLQSEIYDEYDADGGHHATFAGLSPPPSPEHQLIKNTPFAPGDEALTLDDDRALAAGEKEGVEAAVDESTKEQPQQKTTVLQRLGINRARSNAHANEKANAVTSPQSLAADDALTDEPAALGSPASAGEPRDGGRRGSDTAANAAGMHGAPPAAARRGASLPPPMGGLASADGRRQAAPGQLDLAGLAPFSLGAGAGGKPRAESQTRATAGGAGGAAAPAALLSPKITVLHRTSASRPPTPGIATSAAIAQQGLIGGAALEPSNSAPAYHSGGTAATAHAAGADAASGAGAGAGAGGPVIAPVAHRPVIVKAKPAAGGPATTAIVNEGALALRGRSRGPAERSRSGSRLAHGVVAPMSAGDGDTEDAEDTPAAGSGKGEEGAGKKE